MDRKMLRFVKKTRSSRSQKRSEQDRKYWQSIELGINGLKSWGRDW